MKRMFFVNWYRQKGRDFPWRRAGTRPYALFVTEMLLRQTRASSVAAIWSEFLEAYPDARKLAVADEAVLRRELTTLGFGRQRAQALISASRWLMEHHGGEVPASEEELLRVPHVGLYGARALLCFAFSRRVAIVDTNVMRFLARHRGLEGSSDIRRNQEAWRLAELALPRGSERTKQHNYGLLDFTAEICKPRGSLCVKCPLTRSCKQPPGRPALEPSA